LLVPEIEKELPLLINDENKLPRRKKYLFDSKSTTRKKRR